MSMTSSNRLGRTEVRVGALGFGAAAIGNLYRPVEDAIAIATLKAAWDGGIGYFDTAPRYGQGLSERRIGALPAQAILSTKVGRVLTPIAPPPPGTERHGFVDGDPFEEHFDYSYSGVMRSFADSLKRLKREHIDIALVHDLGTETHGNGNNFHLETFLRGGLMALQNLKAQGLIGAIGLGVNETAICDEVMAHADIDAILLAGRYTLLEQTPLDGFFDRCAARGVSVLAAAPFNSGLLAGGAHFNYATPPAEIVDRVRRIEAVCAEYDVPLAAAAIQFPGHHPVVASTVVGMARPEEVARNLSLFNHPIPAALWRDLKSAGLLRADAPVAEPARV
ncbi:aldo/keto reductase [Asticcacaulis sp. AND118]|uniref:aldo/keto reductase n=1 Tax=Asticcacaulis sp. AND118 TaxID=2840468 RepID=UPI001CFF776A|nr:aldo/keto reductase [Asticcacaulis sp. AND118]UDF03094.1 aldo/keto reductase [Asticcacaulis sp. AND118]